MRIVGVNRYVMVDEGVASRLRMNWRGPMPVYFCVNGSDKARRVNLMPVGDGRFRLYLNGNIRKESKLHVGDVVDIEVRFDSEHRGGPLNPMPAWFRKELSSNLPAKRGWDQLAPSRQREILRYFAQLKSPEAKQRNVQRAMHVLAGGKGSWNESERTTKPRQKGFQERQHK